MSRKRQTFHSSFAQTLLLSVLSLFFFFFLCIVSYQYQREKEYKIGLMHQKLEDYNLQIIEELKKDTQISEEKPSPELEHFLTHFAPSQFLPQLRITLINQQGKVIYDNRKKGYRDFEDHRERPEVKKALQNGTGYNVRRFSETIGTEFFYVATRAPDGYIVRSALPYGATLNNSLKIDYGFISFAILLLLSLIIIFYMIICKIDISITRLREFTLKIDRNEPIDEDEEKHFPNNELGEISQHLIRIYKNITRTKGELLEGREKLLEQKSLQVQQRKELTQNIAHELKTPVASIQGYLETIVNTPHISAEKQKEFLDKCYAQSNRLSRLLKDISLLTRMDEASDMFVMEQFDIQVLVENIINELSLQLEERDIIVRNGLDAPLPIKGNASLIYSIFRNLMDNAIAYAGEHIFITLSLTHIEGNYYGFSFADNGIGMDEAHLERIFERFYRVDKGRSRKLGGTGLGLAIVKNAILIHGGNITARNLSPHGLSFDFTLKK